VELAKNTIDKGAMPSENIMACQAMHFIGRGIRNVGYCFLWNNFKKWKYFQRHIASEASHVKRDRRKLASSAPFLTLSFRGCGRADLAWMGAIKLKIEAEQ
jgi:hypothetical protein